MPWLVAAFYAYGALVQVLNMLGFSGFDWPAAQLKWQVLDVVYLLLDLAAPIGLPLGSRLGYLAFFLAAGSQILLYTALRDWVLGVPEAFARSAEDLAYLDALLAFHVVTLAAVGLAIWLKREAARPDVGQGRDAISCVGSSFEKGRRSGASVGSGASQNSFFAAVGQLSQAAEPSTCR